MITPLCVKLEGLPEKVQQIADAIDEAFPGRLTWIQSVEPTRLEAIKIEGYEIRRYIEESARPK